MIKYAKQWRDNEIGHGEWDEEAEYDFQAALTVLALAKQSVLCQSIDASGAGSDYGTEREAND